MPCPICNRTIASGDFCDDLQCPNPTRDAAEGAGRQSANLLRGWAKAYRDTPEHRFPSDPNAEFFPVDLECAADLLSAPPKPAPDAMRADDDIDRLLFFEPSGDGMRACIHDADGYIFCEANYDDFSDPSFPERIMKRMVERLSAPVPPADGAGEKMSFDELTRISEKADYIEAHADEGGTGSAANLQEMVGYIRRLASFADDVLQGFIRSPSGTGAAEPVATPQQVQEACAQVADRAAQQDEGYAAKYPDEARKFDQRAHRAKTIATSIRSLIPPYATPPVRGDREAIEPILNFARAIPDNVDDATGIAYAPFAKAMGVAASLTAGQFRRLLSLPVQAGAGEREVADQIIGDIERRFPDWKSYRDLVDCIDITLHNLRRGQQ